MEEKELPCSPSGPPDKRVSHCYYVFGNVDCDKQLNDMQHPVSLIENKSGTIVVGKHLEIKKNPKDNSFEFTTKKHSRFYPIHFTVTPNDILKAKKVSRAEGHPIKEQEIFFDKSKEGPIAFGDYHGPFINELHQWAFLDERNYDICPISFITNENYPHHSYTGSISYRRIKLEQISEDLYEKYQNKYIQQNNNNSVQFDDIPIIWVQSESKHILLESKKGKEISNQTLIDNNKYWYDLILDFYNKVIHEKPTHKTINNFNK